MDSANVSTGIGQIVVQGFPVYVAPAGLPSAQTLTVTTLSGSPVPAGTLTAAPSPLPTPHATLFPSGNLAAIPIATLSPATNYVVTAASPAWDGAAPACYFQVVQPIGFFKTQ